MVKNFKISSNLVKIMSIKPLARYLRGNLSSINCKMRTYGPGLIRLLLELSSSTETGLYCTRIGYSRPGTCRMEIGRAHV